MSERYAHAHPLTKLAQGLLMDCSDDMPREVFAEFDDVLSRATDAAKDVEGDRDAYRERALRAEAEVRALREAQGELLGLVDARLPAMTGDLLRGNRSAALTAHDAALDGLVALLEGAGTTVGDWRPLTDELDLTAQQLEDEANQAHELLDNDGEESDGC